MNKRGQMSTDTIIALAIGLVILVLAIVAANGGFGQLNLFVKSGSNANTISTQCLAACTTSSVYDFCSRPQDLNNGTATLKSVTCNFLSQPQYSQYGINPCSAISCSNIVFSQSQCSTGKTLQVLNGGTLESSSC